GPWSSSQKAMIGRCAEQNDGEGNDTVRRYRDGGNRDWCVIAAVALKPARSCVPTCVPWLRARSNRHLGVSRDDQPIRRGIGDLRREAIEELGGDLVKETVGEDGTELAKEAIEGVGIDLVKEVI